MKDELGISLDKADDSILGTAAKVRQRSITAREIEFNHFRTSLHQRHLAMRACRLNDWQTQCKRELHAYN